MKGLAVLLSVAASEIGSVTERRQRSIGHFVLVRVWVLAQPLAVAPEIGATGPSLP
jgi:hypothetical protein